MSSIKFEVKLRPDPAIQRLVLGTGIAATIGGVMLITELPISLLWRFALVVIWLGDGLRELRNLHVGAGRVRTLILDSAGNVSALDFEGNAHELRLLTGSMVLPALAWFRLKFESGPCHCLLLIRYRTEPDAWHRLQLLWLQSREFFGHLPGP
ncbi:MAG: hypothetical protein O3A13_07215 [Proteobacteria bacterium]|nr:hypothetical protein [Pseudomonadota bacterium]MDA0993408.1 hypothetical protein [Pseudomonadota bacterium]